MCIRDSLNTVAKDLKVPPSYIPAFIGIRLKARIKKDKRGQWFLYTPTNDVTIRKIEQIFLIFLKKFILCPTCNLPEIYFTSVQRDLAKSIKKKTRRQDHNKCNVIAYNVTAVCRSCPWEMKVDQWEAIPKTFRAYIASLPPEKSKKESKTDQDPNTLANGLMLPSYQTYDINDF
eukprot:TRINITY_DN9948_c0_g1_i2.p1 TRINITY_DN9948_c0_g1~~TRINITY_DN9948_c0_g1_i2.p1  ORF type:complete len:175 (-),score=9.64 TRINITY_DN9948_c0_g1_i2:30-554(-)